METMPSLTPPEDLEKRLATRSSRKKITKKARARSGQELRMENGAKLAAASYAGPAQIAGTGLIYTSADSGSTWTNASPQTNYCPSVASSSDGTHLIAVSLLDQSLQYPGVTWRSSNSGVNWSEDILTGYFNSAGISADGAKPAVTDVARNMIYTFGEPSATAPAMLPLLSIAPVGDQLSLAWGISNAAGFLLFSCTNLAPPAACFSVTNLPTLGSNRIRVILPTSLQIQFFRLSQP